MSQFNIVLVIFFAVLSFIAVARIFTFYDGDNYFLQLLSQTWDGIYNILSYGSLISLMISFGVSVQLSQRLKDEKEHKICRECIMNVLERKEVFE